MRWNLAKDRGWDDYKIESDKVKDKLLEVVHNKNISIEEAKKKFDKLHDKIKYRAFGKVTITQNRKEKGEERVENENEEKDEERTARKIWEEQVNIVEKEMAVIDKLRNGKVGKIWEVRKKVLGGKNTMMQATAIINPETGRLAVTKDEALNATLKYCKET